MIWVRKKNFKLLFFIGSTIININFSNNQFKPYRNGGIPTIERKRKGKDKEPLPGKRQDTSRAGGRLLNTQTLKLTTADHNTSTEVQHTASQHPTLAETDKML